MGSDELDAGLAGDAVLSDEVFRLIFEASPVGVGLADENGHFLAVNPSLCRLFGRPAGELIGRSSIDWTHPEDRPFHGRAGALVGAAEDGIARVEKRFVRPSGEIRWAWLTFSHTKGPAGQTWTLAHMQDVTERIVAEDALRKSEAELRAVAAVMRQLAGGDHTADIRPDLVRAAADLANADLALLLEPGPSGRLAVRASTDDRLAGRTVLSAAPPWAAVWSGSAPVLLGATDVTATELFTADADEVGSAPQSVLLVPVLLRQAPVAVLAVGWRARRPTSEHDPTGTVALLAGQTAVALHQSRLMQDLAELANTDELSGLPNRRGWGARLPGLMDLAKATGRDLHVAVADLDRFKDFNDANGHAVGDRLIQDFAAAARRVLPPDALFARWGGEEFALAFVVADEADPLALVERVRRTVPARQTCSVGYAVWDGAEAGDALLERADDALYRAKLAGRDRSMRAS